MGGDLKVISRKDTAIYEGKQRNLGATVDADLLGAGSSVCLNGGKTNFNSDTRRYTAQAGFWYKHKNEYLKLKLQND